MIADILSAWLDWGWLWMVVGLLGSFGIRIALDVWGDL